MSQEAAAALIATLAASFANVAPQQPGSVLGQTPAEDPFAGMQKAYLRVYGKGLRETDQVRGMRQKLRSYLAQVMMYERPQYQQKALSVIPLAAIQEKARANLPQGGDMKEEVMRQLLRWFKRDFFTWTDQAKCHVCSGKTESRGVGPATPAELQFGGSRVEIYFCRACNVFTRFPRYNDPAKLLETRTGRCGEWSNAFTLCCRALGYDARFVLDWTDHVWTEVYIESKKRWVHCDPSEAAYDTPMVYEAGWGKKLSYVLAFSHEEVVDVTRRYTRHQGEVAKRRRDVPERWLKLLIAELAVELRRPLSAPRVEVLTARYLDEQAEFVAPRAVKQDEQVGRVSGSLEWRQNRGETGSAPVAIPALANPDKVVFDLSRAGSLEGLEMSGSARALTDAHTGQGALQLTPNENDKTGSLFVREMLPVAGGFVCEFSFVIRQAGADGFAFVIHNDEAAGARALGRGGCELGYGGLRNSLAIEFDNFENVDRTDDPSGNHISIHTQGHGENLAHHKASVACTSNIPNLASGEVLHVRVVYDPSGHQLSVQLTDNLAREYVTVLSARVDLSNTIQLSSAGGAWIGLTGATGGLSQEQLVFSLRFWRF